MNSSANGKRKKALTTFVGVCALAGIGYGAYYMAFSRYSESTDNAYIAGDMVMVSSQVAGNVKTVAVDDNQGVSAKQLLVELDDTDAKLTLSQAEAQLAETVRSVQSLFDQVSMNKAGAQSRQADISKASEDVNRLTTELSRAQADLARREAAFKQGAVSAEELEHARSMATQLSAQLSAANASVQQTQAGLAQAQASLSSSLNQTRNVQVANHPRVLQAMAHVREAYVNLQRTKIVAPVAGQVSKRSVQVGARIWQELL